MESDSGALFLVLTTPVETTRLLHDTHGTEGFTLQETAVVEPIQNHLKSYLMSLRFIRKDILL